MVKLYVANALNCQKEAVEIIIDKAVNYPLCVQNNHADFKEDMEDFLQDNMLLKTMETVMKSEKNRDRIEKRTAFVTSDIDWLNQKEDWKNLCCIGAVHTEFETKKCKSDEWHYYIASCKLSPEELLHHARMKWAVESMHWLFDVYFEDDWCRVEDKTVQQNLNMLRKAAINLIKLFKSNTSSKKAISKIMFDCLLDPKNILRIFDH